MVRAFAGRFSAWLLGTVLTGTIILSSGTSAFGESASTVAKKKAAPTALPRSNEFPLEDQPDLLVPKTVPTEREEDHLEALAHFSTARACEHREKFASAIRHYQRAYRYDQSPAALWPIVSLAEQLHRSEVRNRYLLLAAKCDPETFDPADLNELADLVSTDDQLRMVADLFEKALTKRVGHKKTTLDIVLQWRLAEIYLVTADYDKAADCAAVVLKGLEKPKSYGITQDDLTKWFGEPHPPYWLFGEYFLLADRLDEAEATMTKAHQAKPDPGRLHLQLARIHLKRHEPEAALKDLAICFRENFMDEGEAPFVLLSQALAMQDKSETLDERLEELLKEKKNNSFLSRFTARHYLKAGHLDKAAALYVKLLEQNPTPEDYAGLLHIYRQKGDIEQLVRILGKAVTMTPSLDSLRGETAALIGDKVLLDKLFAAADKRLVGNPTALGSRVPLGLALLAVEANRLDTAGRFFGLALQVPEADASDILLLWGGALMGDNQFDAAADVFRHGAKSKLPAEDRTYFYYYLASALELGGRTDEAIAAARKAYQLDRRSPLMAAHECWILYHAQRNEAAREAYDRLIELFDADYTSPTTRQVLREARLIVSHLEDQRGNPQRAAERLEQVLDEFPGDISAMNDLGYLWANRGVHLERSLRMVRTAIKAEPDNAAYLDSLGWVLYRMGRVHEAKEALEKAATEMPEGEILDHLGEVYWKLNDSEQAVEVWQKAESAYQRSQQTEAAAAVVKKIKRAAAKVNDAEDEQKN